MKHKNEARDKIIRKTYRYGQGGQIGRNFGITRQRVWQIIRDNSQTHHDGILRGLRRWTINYIGRLIVRQ